ncbi:zinc ABC transporter substrate-binding protein [Marivita sp. S2033]|uniref:zinc ABC transporter substrate-binding protein n=1 Tax=Marivita sp. S2033 TaxID=3373187 RepID=UPI003982C1D0
MDTHMLRPILIALTLSLPFSFVQADTPRVVTDIAPVHGLVSMVMEGIAEPVLLIQPTDSPHTNAMRPSSAAALQNADVVFWVGPQLTSWLQGPLDSLADGALMVALLDLDETHRLPFRDSDAFEPHEHDHAHDNHAATTDPHAWLDPGNATVWLARIAETLKSIDPEHAAQYDANASDAQSQIAKEVTTARDLLTPLAGRPFVVFHDAYHYFEAAFDLHSMGALALSDAASSGPSHIAGIQSIIREQGVVCVFSEPQFNDRLVRTVIDGTPAKSIELDPLGASLSPGVSFYPALIRDMAQRFAECLQ